MARAQHSIEVRAPVHAVYSLLTQFDTYPCFMQEIDEVQQVDATHLRWHTRSSTQDMQWDAEIIEQVPDRYISWRMLDQGSERLSEAGSVALDSLDTQRTQVTMMREQHAGAQGDEERESALKQRMEKELEAFKRFAEEAALGRDVPRQPTSAYVPAADSSDGNEDPGMPAASSSPQTSTVHASRGVKFDAPNYSREEESRSEQNHSILPQAASRILDRLAHGSEWLSFLQTRHVPPAPLAMVRRVTSEMEHALERFISQGKQERKASESVGWMPPLELVQRGQRLHLLMDLPGVSRDNVRVELTQDKVIIEGDRRQDMPLDDVVYWHAERTYGYFYREVPLPDHADTSDATAVMHDGVLEISMSFAGERKHGRRLDIGK